MKATLCVLVTFFAFPLLASESPEIVLRLKEKMSMEQLAQNVMDPQSSRYEKYYSPEEIRKLAGPSRIEYSNFKAALKKSGFKIIRESKTRLFITVTAERKTLENAFSMHLTNDFD